MANRILCRRAPTPAASSKLLQRLIFNPNNRRPVLVRTFAPSSSSAIRSFSANATTVESDPDRLRSYSSKDAEKLVAQMKADLRALSASCGHLIGMDIRRAWEIVAEDEDAVYIHFDMPGLSKEHVTVSVEDGKVLVIRGEDQMQSVESKRCYTSRIELPDNIFKLDETKAVMENGVLKVTVPKVMEEESKDDDGYDVKNE